MCRMLTCLHHFTAPRTVDEFGRRRERFVALPLAGLEHSNNFGLCLICVCCVPRSPDRRTSREYERDDRGRSTERRTETDRSPYRERHRDRLPRRSYERDERRADHPRDRREDYGERDDYRRRDDGRRSERDRRDRDDHRRERGDERASAANEPKKRKKRWNAEWGVWEYK